MTNHPNRKRSTRTVTLIRKHSGFDNIPDQFQVMMPAARVDEDNNEEIATYWLPEGYAVAPSIHDELEIYDRDGRHCEIVMHGPTGRPQLVGSGMDMPVLKRAGALRYIVYSPLTVAALVDSDSIEHALDVLGHHPTLGDAKNHVIFTTRSKVDMDRFDGGAWPEDAEIVWRGAAAQTYRA